MTRLPYLRRSDEGTLVEVYVQPRANRNEICGLHGASLKIRLTAPPVEGEANRECIKMLAGLFGVAKSDIELLQGHKSRHKTLLVRNRSPESIEVLLKEKGL